MQDELAALWAEREGEPGQLKEAAHTNVAFWLQRLGQFQPPSLGEKVLPPLFSTSRWLKPCELKGDNLSSLMSQKPAATEDVVSRKISQLIEAATSASNLALMDPTWVSPF